jgi:stress response protein YsnF
MEQSNDKKKGTGAGAVAGAAAGGVAGGAAAGAAVGGMTGPAGAAVGAAVGAGLGAVTGRKAADDGTSGGSYGEGRSMHTVIGAFDDSATAQRAVDRLTQAGFDRDDVHLQYEQGSEAVRQQPERTEKKSGGFFASLFGMDDAEERREQQSPYAEQAYTYDEAVRRGSAVVVVDAQDERQADQACSLLHELGAVDVDERSKQWRAEGWQPPVTGTQQNLTGRQGDVRTDQGKVLDVVEEELQVGKRTLDRGGVRVVQRVSSKPVRELVRLREEHAVVERRAVDRPATGGDLSNFKEGTLEVRESVEEPVVAKTARVVEEVRVGKEVREREQTIEDNVRRKDVDVERLAGQAGRTERERAVAKDESLTGVRKTSDKDKPL